MRNTGFVQPDAELIAIMADFNIYGFAYTGRKGNYHIVLNGNMSYEAQCKAYSE